MLSEKDSNQPQEEKAVKPRSRRKPQPRKRVQATQPEPGEVKVKADFTLPVGQFARLTSTDGEDDYETIEEAEEDYPPYDRNLLYGAGLASVPFLSPVDDEDRTESVRDHLRAISEANAFKAKIWRVPEAFAIRNPLIQRKPTSAPGWAYQGEIAYDPECLDSDLLTLFSDGYYFVEVRERGTYRNGMLKTIGNPSKSNEQPMVPPPQVIVQESNSHVDPLRDATAQAKVMNSVVEAATKLLSAQASLQPAQPKVPSLKDRLEELQMLQRMFAPSQPLQQRDPLEKLAEALESETLRKILGTIKSENPVEPVEERTTFWDFAMGAVEQLAPGLNPLLAGLGRMLMSSGLSGNQQSANPSAKQPPVNGRPQLAEVKQADQPETVEPATEDDGVDIRFLIEDLANNVEPETVAQKVKDLMANKPFVRPFLKKYLAADNQSIWDDLIGLAESEEEAANLRQALEACEWREDWLNSLKQHLS